MKIYALIITAALAGCKYDEQIVYRYAEKLSPSVQADIAPISPLYMEPYTTVATPYEETPDLYNVTVTQGNVSCTGSCELPLTGARNAIFYVSFDEIKHDLKMSSTSSSFVCYKMQSGWYVIQKIYHNETRFLEATESCFHGTYEIDGHSWDWDTIIEARVEMRSSSTWTFRR